ncbi:aromatic acid exporter family protein [Tumebacillus sp. ITR2]|uniref:Aromatic acid exporter family protein n=1 Tax=Tumebacillus amylolyticus TaxID=2801339 RepID=A0ABS1J6T2_9BACL|nr:aromatic acid exporter family protein [Tumebacillus amylolyticus]MBL0385992.1 aromatic acid exporter family protein [Tumebacillus amylolyticus]
MKIGFRTIKTAVGSALSIYVASYLGLEFYSFAGILTMLCLRETVKRSFRDAWERFVACLIGIAFAVLAFHLFGFHPWVIGLILLFLIPTSVMLKVQGSVLTACVIILHMFMSEHVGVSMVLNELKLVAVGIGAALLMNSYMPNREKELVRLQKQIEGNFKSIFQQIARFLREGATDWEGREITETVDILRDALKLALEDIENHVLREETGYYAYFLMRSRQFEIIQRIMLTLSPLEGSYEQGRQIADYLDEMSVHIAPGTREMTQGRLDSLARLQDEFKKADLPQNRHEFENRAALLHFIHDMERYLKIKQKWLIRDKR